MGIEMKFRLTHADGVARVTEVLEAITISGEWARSSDSLAASDWSDGREPFRRFFDVYEGAPGTEWLGIMEWAVVEEVRSGGSVLTVDPTTIDRIMARMSGHPNIELLR
jgi:hypothetical protein